MTQINSILIITCLAIGIATRPASSFTYIISPHGFVRTKIQHYPRSMFVISSLASGGKDDESILEAEDAAAFDAHDLSDAGMEAAAMERAVMMAEEYKHDHEKMAKHEQKQTTAEVNKTFVPKMESGDSDEALLEAEEAAAFDAHDLSDAGMEAAAMERAVIMANEMKKKH
ncbi:hypothetical protein ACHAXN_002284 [Cyclotella atomus]